MKPTSSSHRVTGLIVFVTAAIGMSIILSVALNQWWAVRRERDQRVWAARNQHLQRVQLLLRRESESLNAIARGLREGRYFTLVANDARKAIWQDEPLTTDVERHFPEYFREREQLIRRVVEYDTELGRIRQVISAGVLLEDATEPYRSDLIQALVNKCGGAAPAISLTTYDQYRCTPELRRACRSLLDRAEDLAETASMASEAAQRYAEETVLHGSCTYAPAE